MAEFDWLSWPHKVLICYIAVVVHSGELCGSLASDSLVKISISVTACAGKTHRGY